MEGEPMPPPPPLVTLVFLKVEGQNLVAWGILMCFLQKKHSFSNSGLLWRHYDVIMGNLEGFVIWLFIKVERQNLKDLGILMCTFQKSYLFLKLKASMTSLWRHNWCKLERPCNFAIFKGRSPKFVGCIILMCSITKQHYFLNWRLLWRYYDVMTS